MANKILTNSSGQVLIFGNKALQIDVTPPVTKNRVGGKIFYIDNTASGAEYTFYDQNEQEN